MKNLFKLAAITSVLAFSTTAVNAADNIAYVNSNYLLQNHPALTNPESELAKEIKDAQVKFAEYEKKLAEEEKLLAEEVKKLEAEEKTVSESIKKKMAALEKEAPRLRSADIKKRQDAINAEGQAFQKKVEDLQKREVAFRKNVDESQKEFAIVQRDISEKQARVQQSIIGEVEKVIAETAKAKGYTLVIDAAAIFYTQNPANNLTEDVFKALQGGKTEASAEKPAETQPAAQPAAK